MSSTRAILSPDHRSALTTFAASNVLLGFDYDGTLAPIAPTPVNAVMRPRTRELLAETAALYPTVVISGRALDDIAQRLTGIPVWHIFGNHGLESGSRRGQPAAPVHGWVERLNRELAGHEGVFVEDKGLTVTVHYRVAADRPAAVAAIERAVQNLPEARVVPGSEALNLLPAGAGDKGVALRDAITLFACTTAIYVGDDATDEDAFAALPQDRLLGIRVGAARSVAGYHLESQADTDALLEALIALRRQPAAK